MMGPFPWRDHFTQKESLALERRRSEVSDDTLLDSLVHDTFMGKKIEDVADYLLRNPRPSKVA